MKPYQKPEILEVRTLEIEAQQSGGLPPEPPPPNCC